MISIKHMKCLFLFILIAFLIITIINSKLVCAQPILLNKDEKYNGEIPVSTVDVLGLMVTKNGLVNQHNSFIVLLPKNHNQSFLRIKIKSHDGMYRGIAYYSIKPNMCGLTKVEYPSDYIKELSSYTDTQLSLLANIGNTMEMTKPYVYILSMWQKNKKLEHADLIVQVADGHNSSICKSMVTDSENCRRCFNFKNDKKHIAFNKDCTIPINWLDTQNIFYLHSSDGFEETAPVPIYILYK